jgi:predicted enzyme related to lactoylglutathione lyase
MKGIEIISIPVTNQQAAKEFYLKMGFTLIVEAPYEGGSNWIQLGIPGSDTSITLVNWFPQMQPGSIRGLVIKCEDLDKDIEEMTARGIVVEPAQKMPWGRFATVIDPDGNAMSLHGK